MAIVSRINGMIARMTILVSLPLSSGIQPPKRASSEKARTRDAGDTVPQSIGVGNGWIALVIWCRSSRGTCARDGAAKGTALPPPPWLLPATITCHLALLPKTIRLMSGAGSARGHAPGAGSDHRAIRLSTSAPGSSTAATPTHHIRYRDHPPCSATFSAGHAPLDGYPRATDRLPEAACARPAGSAGRPISAVQNEAEKRHHQMHSPRRRRVHPSPSYYRCMIMLVAAFLRPPRAPPGGQPPWWWRAPG